VRRWDEEIPTGEKKESDKREVTKANWKLLV
jgi:hypothetical protein